MKPTKTLGNLSLTESAVPKVLGCPLFRKGNQYARKENMSAESNARRAAGIQRAWIGRDEYYRKARLARSVAELPKNSKTKMKKQAKRQRLRLRETVAKEAREIQELGRRNADAVMRRMVEIATTSFNETAAISAAQVVLDRSYGKANQTSINAHIDANGKTSTVSEKELNARIDQTLKRVEELTGGKEQPPKSKTRPIDLRKFHRDPNGSPLN